jgi:hypothetical protein
MSEEPNSAKIPKQNIKRNRIEAIVRKPISLLIGFINFAKYLAWLLYLSRISLISAAVGVYILVFTLQARDLFLEVRSNSWALRGYWSLFYFLVVFAWLLPIHISATYMIEWAHKRSLAHHPSLKQIASTRFADVMRKAVPLLIVIVCLFALGWSQYLTWKDLHALLGILTREQIAAVKLPIPNAVLLIQATMLTAVLFVSSRRELAFRGSLSIKYLLYSIGMSTAVLALWFVFFAPNEELQNYMSADEKQGFLVINGLPFLQWLRLCFPYFIALLWIFVYASFFRLRHELPGKGDLVVPTIIVALACLIVLFFVNPLWLGRYAERALLLPVILGVWIPLFSGLSVASTRTGFPFVISSLLVIAVFAVTNKAHVVKAERRAQGEQLKLNAALDAWKEANGCSDKPDGAGCPSLVLVATQGGASRSAFFTGSVLGHILDENGIESTKRIFAMSGVSGGSAGLAFFSAALLDSAATTNPKTGQPASPCQTLTKLRQEEERAYLNRSGFQNWFGSSQYYRRDEDWISRTFGLTVLAPEDSEETSYRTYWRNCLQLLASGDFLSPVFIRASGTDFLGLNRVMAAIGHTLSADRAKMLESAWEQHYERIAGSDTLSRNFLDFAPSPSKPKDWKPLLLFNATSADNGRRVIASHLYPWYCDLKGAKRRLFNDAYDLHEVFSAISPREDGYDHDDCKCVQPPGSKRPVLECEKSKIKYDFKLSTAASLSSRFPIVSPQADLVAKDAGDHVLARVVDGGYFENHGATSLFDLVTAIKWLQEKMPIHIILITNDPAFERGDCLEHRKGDPVEDQRNPLPMTENYQFWSGLRSIAGAALETRSARGTNAAINLCKLQWSFKDLRFTHIGVRKIAPKIRDISMSWWLSYPVQLYLDRQLGHKIIDGTPRTLGVIPAPLEENQKSFDDVKQMLQEKSS